MQVRHALWSLALSAPIPAAVLAQAPSVPASAAVQPLSAEALRVPADAVLAGYPADAPGATAIVTRGGRTLWTGARGLADLERRAPLTPDSVIRLGSITKQFAAAALLLLVEEGRVSLDDPVSKFVPDYPAPGAAATVRQLLNHSSGIQSYTGIPGWMTEANTARRYSTAELIAQFRDSPAPTPPGAAWSYNNSGYVLVGAVIEAVTGKPWHVVVAERLTGPLGLSSIRYGNDAPTPAWATGYTAGGRPAQRIDMSVPHAAGGLVGSVRDLARWSAALHGGRVLKPASYAQMIASTVTADGKTAPYGFGLETATLRGLPVVAHGGGIFGGSTHALYLPESDTFVAVFANSDAPTIAPSVVASRLAALAVGRPYPTLAADVPDLAAMADIWGLYRFENETGPAAQWRIYQRDGRAYARGTTEREIFADRDGTLHFGPTRLDRFRPVRAAGQPLAMVGQFGGDDTSIRAVRVGPLPPETPAVALPRATLARYLGGYAMPMGRLTIAWGQGDALTAQLGGQPALPLRAVGDATFEAVGVDARVEFTAKGAIIHQDGHRIAGTRLP